MESSLSNHTYCPNIEACALPKSNVSCAKVKTVYQKSKFLTKDIVWHERKSYEIVPNSVGCDREEIEYTITV